MLNKLEYIHTPEPCTSAHTEDTCHTATGWSTRTQSAVRVTTTQVQNAASGVILCKRKSMCTFLHVCRISQEGHTVKWACGLLPGKGAGYRCTGAGRRPAGFAVFAPMCSECGTGCT